MLSELVGSEIEDVASAPVSDPIRVLIYAVAVVAHTLEKIFDNFITTTTQAVREVRPYNSAWFRERIFSIPTVNVTRVAFRRNSMVGASLILLVAKNEPPEPLSGSELSDVADAVRNDLPPGISFSASTSQPDQLAVSGLIVVRRGTDTEEIKERAIERIEGLLANLDTQAKVYSGDIITELSSIEGVEAIPTASLQVRYLSSGNYVPGLDIVSSHAGYFIYDKETFDNLLVFNTIDDIVGV